MDRSRSLHAAPAAEQLVGQHVREDAQRRLSPEQAHGEPHQRQGQGPGPAGLAPLEVHPQAEQRGHGGHQRVAVGDPPRHHEVRAVDGEEEQRERPHGSRQEAPQQRAEERHHPQVPGQRVQVPAHRVAAEEAVVQHRERARQGPPEGQLQLGQRPPGIGPLVHQPLELRGVSAREAEQVPRRPRGGKALEDEQVDVVVADEAEPRGGQGEHQRGQQREPEDAREGEPPAAPGGSIHRPI